jgi:hypothetical protein
MFVFLENQDSAAFTHDEPVSFSIERTRCSFRFIVPRAHRSHRAEPTDAKVIDDRLGPSG